MRLSHDMELVLLKKVKVWSSRASCHQASTRLNVWHMSWRLAVASSSSEWGGAWSSGSLVRLKSLSRRFRIGREWLCQAIKRSFQKPGCSDGVLGAYTAMMESFSEPCHVRERWAARPGMRGVILADSGLMMALFRTKATPAELPGWAGSAELRRWSCFANRVSI